VEINENAHESGTEQSGTEGLSGESSFEGTAGAGGESGEDTSQAGGESGSGTELPEGITPEMLSELGYMPDKDYKSLQGEFSKKTDALKAAEEQFGKYGGADKVLEWVGYLDGNAEFAKWVQSQQDEKLYGQDKSQFDDETRQAMELVERIADEKIAEAMRLRVDPLANSYKSRLLQESFKTMDGKYDDWREMEGPMEVLSHTLPPDVADNPSVSDLEALYFRALAQEGKLEDYGRKVYERNLTALKTKNTDKTTASGASGGRKPSNTIAEGFAAAKKSLKLT
jgi:hypothetical protein